jgi:high-affinity nickel-transport protein
MPNASICFAVAHTARCAPATAAGTTNDGSRFTRAEWLRLAGFYGAIALLHLSGWGIFLYHAARFPSLVGLGLAAYLFGLRHAFDVDHIAAIDDTVRYLLSSGKKPLGVGFFFSLGHSAVVLIAAMGLICFAASLKSNLPALREMGSIIGAGVSGTFLWVIGILNVLVLLDILKVWKKARTSTHNHAHLDEVLQRRGLLRRILGGRPQKLISQSWQMFPLGLLFGLGLDTAAEVGLLGMTASASVGDLPALAALSLPLLFAAGMSLMDTTDGVLMVRAYDWAAANPLRRIFYNFTTTAIAVLVALFIGTVQLLQAFTGTLGLRGSLIAFVNRLELGSLGFAVVGIFLFAWGAAAVMWRFGRKAARDTHQSQYTAGSTRRLRRREHLDEAPNPTPRAPPRPPAAVCRSAAAR